MIGTPAGNNWIHDNCIGVDPAYEALPNGEDGVEIHVSAQNTVENNTISGNLQNGVRITGGSGNTVLNNYIGLGGALRRSAAGSGYNGVAVGEGAADTIGPGNRIAYNGLSTSSDGVMIDGGATTWSASWNCITQNSIYANGGQGIALVNNGNDGQPPPAISEADCGHVEGTACAGCTGCTVEIFSDAGYQGRIYEGSTTATPASAFNWTGKVHGPNVTATAADNVGNTSQFSVARASACLHLYLPFVVKSN